MRASPPDRKEGGVPRAAGGERAGTGPSGTAGAVELGEPELAAWGRRLGALVARQGVFVALYGPLGAGKTTLVQAACRGAGVEEPVTSPTYALAHRYRGERGVVHHVDLYRIEDPSELVEIGWEDLVAGDEPVFVEWADRAGDWLPGDRWEIRLSMGSVSRTRRVRLARHGGAPRIPDPGARGTEDPPSVAGERKPVPSGSRRSTGT